MRLHQIRVLFPLSLCLLLCVLIQPTLGVEDEKNEPIIFELGRIEVVGFRDNVITSPQTTVTKGELDAKLAESVIDGLRDVPGLVTTVGDKNEPEFMLRGLFQKKVLILMDGVPMAAPYYGDLDTSEIPLDSLAEIRIIRGNASVLYGPNALAGVVSLVSAIPDMGPNFSIMSTVDHVGNFSGRLAHGQRIGPFYFQLSTGIRNSDGWPMSDQFKPSHDEDGNVTEDGDIRENAGFQQWSGSFKVGTIWTDGELSLALHHIDAEKEIPPATQHDSYVRYWEFPVWKKTSAVLAGRSRITDTIDFRTNVFYHKYDNVLRNYSDADHANIRWESTYDDYSTGITSRLAWQIAPEITLRSSLSAVFDNHRSQGDTDDPWEEYNAVTYALGIENEWVLNAMWMAVAGISEEIYDFDDTKNVNGEQAALEKRTEDVESMSFNIGVRWQPVTNHTLMAAIARRNMFPTMHELFSNIEEAEPDQIGKLKAEESLQYQVNYRFTLDPVEAPVVFDISLFRYDVKNMIERPSSDDLYANIDKAVFQGLEFLASIGQNSGMKASMTYTYTQANDVSHDRVHDELPFVPQNVIRTDLGYRFANGLSILVGYTWKDEVFEYDSDDNQSTVPAYGLLDSTIRYSFDSGISLTLRGENLLDENYYKEYGFEQPGRVVTLGFGWQL